MANAQNRTEGNCDDGLWSDSPDDSVKLNTISSVDFKTETVCLINLVNIRLFVTKNQYNQLKQDH